MNSNYPVLAGFIAGLLLVLNSTGCSRPPPPQIEGVIDACEAISGVEPETILGEPVNDVQEMRNDNPTHKVYIRHCYKYSESGRDKQYGVMIQQDLSDRPVKSAAEQLQAIKQNAADHGARSVFKDVPGLGEAAAWNEMMHQMVVIDDEGRTVYRFNVIGADNELEKAKLLAGEALGEPASSTQPQALAAEETPEQQAGATE